MCGIAGMIDLTSSKRQAPRGAVDRMAQAIFHRGPDEVGDLDRPGLHLVNRRLSIVGLADGRQPISNEEGTVWTVFNGELFDYPERRKDLEAKGHVFRTHTDTELIPHLWEEYREGMWDYLKGQFAICVWDSRTNEFMLGRDRAGICPLFYTVQKIDGTDWLLFGSEMKALFASGFVPAKADPVGLNHIFTFFAMPGPATVFEGISQVPPGCYVKFQPGTASPDQLLKRRIYWEVNYPDEGQEEYGSDETKLVDEFEAVLYASVQRRLRADVPVVSYLSGGVDSSLVVAMASKALGRPIPTFTVGVTQEGMNEESEAMQTAKALGCEPVVVKCGHEQLREGYPELVAASEFPVIDTASVGMMELARSVHSHGYKVALTGEGADEWLGGYPWFKYARMAKPLDIIPGLGYRARRLFLRLTGQPVYPAHMVAELRKYLGGTNGWMDVYGMMSLNKLRFFSPDLKQFALSRLAYADLDLTEKRFRWHPFHRQMYLGARIMLPGHLLACKGDRVAMHSSVEGRYPFLDEDVVAFMAKLHPRWKLRGLTHDKFIERKVAERWLPKETAWRKKKMFRAPMDSWVKNVGQAGWIAQVLSPESLKKTGYFDAAKVIEGMAQLSQMKRSSPGKTGLEMGLTAVTATQVWHHLYLGGGLCDLPTANSGSNGAANGLG